MPTLLLLTVIGSVVATVALAAAFNAMNERFPTEHVLHNSWRREDPEKPEGQALPVSIDRSVRQLRRSPFNELEWAGMRSRLDDIGRRFEEPASRPALPVGDQRQRWWEIWKPKVDMTQGGAPSSYNEVWLDARLAQLEAHVAGSASRSAQSRQQPLPAFSNPEAPSLPTVPTRKTTS